MDISKMVDVIRLSPKYLLAVFLASGFLVFAPDGVVESFGLEEFRTQYRIWIGVPLLASGSLLGAHLLATVGDLGWKRFLSRRNLRTLQGHLASLSAVERAALRGYFAENTKTQYFQIGDGVAEGLVAMKILYRSSNVGDALIGFAYNIQPWAWDYLKQNPHLIAVPEGE